MGSPVIQVSNLKRIYRVKEKNITALNNISFEILKGECVGIIGPNGAGKTTLIKILSTFLLPSFGTVLINNKNVVNEYKEIRNNINYVYGGDRGLYWRLSVYDNLYFFGTLYKISKRDLIEKISKLLYDLNIEDLKFRRIETLSKGQKQRIQIARGLLNSPKVLLLDEPTIGLDPVGTKKLHEIIIKMKEEGRTILITSHYMSEIENLCNKIVFINDGKIIENLSTKTLKEKYLNSGFKTLEEYFVYLSGDVND